ncbi:MAG: phytoene desaturase, partial [Planctomycetota bacterium]
MPFFESTAPAPPRRAAAQSQASGSRAIVVGAGFGGMAAALRLKARGYDVTLLDRLERPGGRA